jgi:hypothetical protein
VSYITRPHKCRVFEPCFYDLALLWVRSPGWLNWIPAGVLVSICLDFVFEPGMSVEVGSVR